jgi:hypothetical protein
VPEKVKSVCELLAPVLAEVGKATGQISYELTGSRRIFLPVWYNTYLSPQMYKEFHWPYLKYIAEELIKAGFTPLLSLQGEHGHLLDTLLELPEEKAIAWFDKTDLQKAKEVEGRKRKSYDRSRKKIRGLCVLKWRLPPIKALATIIVGSEATNAL